MKRVAATLLLSALRLTGPADAQEIVGRNVETFSLTETIRAGNWVRIATPNGSIRVTQGGDRVELKAVKDVERGEVEDVGFVVRRAAGGLTVCAVFEDGNECDDEGGYRSGKRSRGWWNNHKVSIDFTVRIPAGVRLKAGSGNGDVSIAGGGAEVAAATGNGDVDVSNTTGEVTASTGNGRITINGAKGPVVASTGSGDVRVTTSLGPVSASSGNGDIDVTMDQVEAAADMNFSTGNGRITVAVPEGFGAELDSNTGNGRVSVDFPMTMRGRMDPSRIRGRIGGGGGRLVLSSGNGDLEIVRRP